MNNNEDKKLTDQKFWDEGYISQNGFFAENLNYPVTKLIYKYFNKEEFKYKTVFEIGCYPGRFLFHFGNKKKFNQSNAETITISLTHNL